MKLIWLRMQVLRYTFLIVPTNYNALIVSGTLYNAILRIARNFLETRESIKISTHPFYHINLGWFSWKWSKKNFFFFEKKFKMADTKKLSFSTSSKAEQFLPKFHGLVLGLVGLIDAMGIDKAQPIWPWGCPSKAQKQPKNAFSLLFGCFFASFPWKPAQIYMVEWMGQNFDVFPGFQKIPCYA